jgi:hypothetical protein
MPLRADIREKNSMPVYNPHGSHRSYTETDRHFAPHSETYTGADSLITAQQQGWSLINIAYEQEIEMHGGRSTSLYYFKLLRGSEKMVMPIVANPFIERMLIRLKILVRPYPTKSRRRSYEQVVDPLAVPREEIGN